MNETKKQITDEINRLKNFGFEVKTMNSHKSMPPGMKGFPDHVIAGHKSIVFVEVKIGEDVVSPEQKKFMGILSNVSVFNKHMNVKFIRTLEEAKRLVDHLLAGTL